MSKLSYSDYLLLDRSSTSSHALYENDAFLVEDDYNKIKDAEVIPIPDTVGVVFILFFVNSKTNNNASVYLVIEV